MSKLQACAEAIAGKVESTQGFAEIIEVILALLSALSAICPTEAKEIKANAKKAKGDSLQRGILQWKAGQAVRATVGDVGDIARQLGLRRCEAKQVFSQLKEQAVEATIAYGNEADEEVIAGVVAELAGGQ